MDEQVQAARQLIARLPHPLAQGVGEFERAAQLRDRIAELKGQPTLAPQVKKRRGRRR
jgi:protein-arginine kinase activator protein McsA